MPACVGHERVKYWLGVGAKPSEKVRVFLKKYGVEGTHLAQQQAARERLALPKVVPPTPRAGCIAAAAEVRSRLRPRPSAAEARPPKAHRRSNRPRQRGQSIGSTE